MKTTTAALRVVVGAHTAVSLSVCHASPPPPPPPLPPPLLLLLLLLLATAGRVRTNCLQ